MELDRTAALRRENAEMLEFCRKLSDDEWRTDSAASGWRVQDVVAHLGSAAHAIFTPTSLKLLGSKDIERTNDSFVEQRRGWQPSAVLAEYERWSPRLVTLSGVVARTPLARVPVPLAELGRFPLGMILGAALVFDQHTHLRHDIAAALGRPAPATDGLRMAVVLEWMFAVLGKQLWSAPPPWLDRPLAITLDGPGGRTWRVGADATVSAGPADDAVAHVTGKAVEFPAWATSRARWRNQDVTLGGDEDYAARFLDSVNVV